MAILLSFVFILTLFSVPVYADNHTIVNNGDVSAEIIEGIDESVMYIHYNETDTTDALRVEQNENDTITVHGWYNVTKESSLNNEQADFKVETVSNNVYFVEKGKAPVFVGTACDQKVYPSCPLRPYAESDFETLKVKSGNFNTDVATATEVVSIIIGLFGVPYVSEIGTLAALIIQNGFDNVYYIWYMHSHIIDNCSQEYYYSFEFYSGVDSNGNYTGYIGGFRTATTTANVC